MPALCRTILLVDRDENALIETASLVAELGCKIVTAGDARDALALLRGGAPVAILLVELLCPGASELVERARSARPGLAVAYMTEYPEMLILDREVAGPAPLLRKPVRPDELRALDARAGRPGEAAPGSSLATLSGAETGRETSESRAWRWKAEELRTIADQTENATAADTLRRLARNYDSLADRAEGLHATKHQVKPA